MKTIAKESVNLIAPDNIKKVWIDPYTGSSANENCPGSVLYPFISGSQPTELVTCTTMEEPEEPASETWIDEVINKF